MASAWADRLPRVTVPQSPTPKRVTFVLPYYDNAEFFARQVQFWREYPVGLQAYVSAVVVDDGSPVPLRVPACPPFEMRAYRIMVDVPWNWLAARNLGAHYAADGWLLLTDMDHVVPHATLRSLVWGAHDPALVYVFSRREHTGAVVSPHSASFFMTKAMFWQIGGYDETLSGHYGTDGEYRRRVTARAKMHVLTDELIRYENVGDSSTRRYARKLPSDAQAVKRLIAQRGPGWRPKTLSFPHEAVPCSVS